jgi:hypothetical protein
MLGPFHRPSGGGAAHWRRYRLRAKFETAGVRRGRSEERVAAPALVVDRQIPVFHIASQGAEMTGSLLASCLAKKLQAIAISLNSLAVNVTRSPNR